MTPAEKTRLLAERVMGWEVIESMRSLQFGGWYAVDAQRNANSFEPMNDLAHAGEVLEALVAKGWTYIARNVSGMHMVGLAKGEPSVRCFAPTLSAAICHAALLTEGVKEEEL